MASPEVHGPDWTVRAFATDSIVIFPVARPWYPRGVQCASRPLCAASIWACFVLSSGQARAENNPETVASRASAAGAKASDRADAPAHAATPESPAAPRTSETEAEAAYKNAQAKYAQRDVQGALDSMRESYRLCQRAELLYNLAVLERELGQCRPALADYTSYLQQVPHGRYREAAQQASTALARECPLAAPVSAPIPSPPPALSTTKTEVAPAPDPGKPVVDHEQSRYWTPPRIVGWSAIGAGALAGGGALYFMLAAMSAKSDYQQNVDGAADGTATLDPSLEKTQHRNQTAAQVLAVTGSALVTGGALVLIFGSKDPTRAKASVQIQTQPDWLRACYTQRFCARS